MIVRMMSCLAISAYGIVAIAVFPYPQQDICTHIRGGAGCWSSPLSQFLVVLVEAIAVAVAAIALTTTVVARQQP